ncbi:MAG: ABC transporter substrate-binding protein [Deltaproteobacteria bacterium]|nr:ABC transporter substrate-binding protein [Deltaproteobacteria bacterium]
MNRLLLTVFAIIMAIPVSRAWASPKDPVEVVRSKYEQIRKVVDRNPEKAAMRKGIRRVMDTFMDFEELSRRTLKGHWKGLKRRQRKAFVKGFKQMIQRTYVKRFNPNRKVIIDYSRKTLMSDDGTATVYTVVHSGRSEAKVDYRFRRKGGRWRAFDVIIDDVSQVKNYRKQFFRIMNKEGFDGLMARIDRKNRKEKEKEERELANEKSR